MESPERQAESALAPAPPWTADMEAPQPRGPVRNGYGRALTWAGLGFLLAGSVILFPVGLLALPFVVAACWSLASRGPHGLEVLALGVGIATVTGWIAVSTADGSCGTSPAVVELAPGQTESCAGIDGGPFAVLTATVLLLLAVVYVIARARWSGTN